MFSVCYFLKYIFCSINSVVKEVKGPLVIPLPSSKTIFDHHKEAKVKRELKLKEENVDNRPDSELTPDELAARELIRGN